MPSFTPSSKVNAICLRFLQPVITGTSHSPDLGDRSG